MWNQGIRQMGVGVGWEGVGRKQKSVDTKWLSYTLYFTLSKYSRFIESQYIETDEFMPKAEPSHTYWFELLNLNTISSISKLCVHCDDSMFFWFTTVKQV